MTEVVSPHRLTVAALQMVSTPSVRENLDAAQRLIARAAEQGARVVALPEYFCLMGRRDADKVAVCEHLGEGPIQEFLKGTAKQHRIWVVGGTLPLAASRPDRVFNTTLVYDPSGTRIARYDKIHLFNFQKGEESYDESHTITPGDSVTRFTVAAGETTLAMGLSICYDLRFPELYRALGNVDLIFVPSAFTYTTGQAHWEILLRARAIENQCYVLAPAQGGVHPNGRRTWGHTMLIDPWGEIKAEQADGESVVIGDIDPNLISSVRQNLPALSHRTL